MSIHGIYKYIYMYGIYKYIYIYIDIGTWVGKIGYQQRTHISRVASAPFDPAAKTLLYSNMAGKYKKLRKNLR